MISPPGMFPPARSGGDNLQRLLGWMLGPLGQHDNRIQGSLLSGRLAVCARPDEHVAIARALNAFRHPVLTADYRDTVHEKLDTRVGPLDLRGMSPVEAVDRLAAQAGVNLVVDWSLIHPDDAATDSRGLMTIELEPMPLRAALSRIFRTPRRQLAINFTVDDNVLLATCILGPQSREAVAFDVRDLVTDYVAYQQSHEVLCKAARPSVATDYAAEAALRLQMVTCLSVTPDAWEGSVGVVGLIIPGKGRLSVVGDADEQSQVSHLLAQLRLAERSGSPQRPSEPRLLQREDAVFQTLSTRIRELQLENVPLSAALVELGRAANTTIDFDASLQDPASQPQKPVTLRMHDTPLHVALEETLRQAAGATPLRYGIADGALLVSERLFHAPLARVYDVRDLLDLWTLRHRMSTTNVAVVNDGNLRRKASFPENKIDRPLQRLEKLLYDSVDKPSWKVSGGFTRHQINFFAGLLIVTQTPENHLQIEALLDGLRRNQAENGNDFWAQD